jgi:hypothetical protein
MKLHGGVAIIGESFVTDFVACLSGGGERGGGGGVQSEALSYIISLCSCVCSHMPLKTAFSVYKSRQGTPATKLVFSLQNSQLCSQTLQRYGTRSSLVHYASL